MDNVMDTEVNCLAVSSKRVKRFEGKLNFVELVANESRMLRLHVSCCWKELVFLLVSRRKA